MALLVFAILNVMCCYFCYFVGTQKGYNGPLCAFAGLFGSFLACLILLLMPDKASDTFNSTAYNREVSELRQQVKDLQKRITELEHCCSKGEKLQSTNHSTVTLLARFRGLSISQPSHKSCAFAGTL